jgi:hypothetical protein
MHIIERYSPHPHYFDLAEELAAGCDPDFDAAYYDLERVFHGIRIQRETSE